MNRLYEQPVFSVKVLLENSPDATLIYKAGESSQILFSNRKAWELFECGDEEEFLSFCGGTYMNLVIPEERDTIRKTIARAQKFEVEQEHRASYQVITNSGRRLLIEDRGSLLHVEAYGDIVLCLLFSEKEATLPLTDITDRLTGLFGRKYFLKCADEILRRADEQGDFQQYAFIYYNIHNFKYFNVRYGTKGSNKVLLDLAKSLAERDPDAWNAHFGADHFVVLVKKDPSAVYADVQKIIARFDRTYEKTGMRLKAGIFHVTKRGEDAFTICDFAKTACDTIKNEKQRFCVYDERIGYNVEIENYVMQNLDTALEKGYIQVAYQPMIRTISGAMCGLEALARWTDPKYGMIPPSDFIPILESNHLVTKLDLYVLRAICKEMKLREENGKAIVPVCINLSALDFQECDIYKEVDRIVLEAGVARDMINIEITESVVKDDPEIYREEIRRFHEGGYQVWMDDFGNGYSSFNVLKTYPFDVIKLDMGFMAAFDEKSKEIIKAVIRMAKKIGIQTLMEGVETPEQYEFLREIGCEKLQGYLFGKPAVGEKLETMIADTRISIEARGWRSYYDAIGKEDFCTDRAFAMVESDGQEFRFLYVNPEYKKVWESLGSTDMTEIYENINSRSSALYKQYHEIQKTLHVDSGEKQMIYTVRGQYVRLTARCIAEYEEHAVYNVEIVNLSSQETEEKREQLDQVIRTIYNVFDSVYVLELSNGRFENILKKQRDVLPEAEEFQRKEIIDPEKAAVLFIHPNDRSEYIRFTDREDLRERLKKAEKGYITRYFRTKIQNGAYVWKAHTMIYEEQKQAVIYCSRRAAFSQPGLIQKVAPIYLAEQIRRFDESYDKILIQGIMESCTLNLFWKDDRHRFIGANEKFLNTYGFSDVSELAGKTDEEMNWHIDHAFQDDEDRVLKNGEVITNRMGKAIIQGIAHNIVVNKEPLYEGSRIVGLFGYFISIDRVNEEVGDTTTVTVTDQATSLMSVQGISNAVSEYVEGWSVRGENFATICVNIDEYHRVVQTYGEKTARKMLYSMGQMIKDHFGNEGVCARLYAANFVVLLKCAQREEVEAVIAGLEERFKNIHTLAGYPVTLNPNVDWYLADEVEDVHMLISMATGGVTVNASG